MAPDQFGLLPSPLAVRAGLRLSWMGVWVLGDPQSLELNLDVFGGAALFPRLVAVLLFVAQNVTLFDETVWKLCQACGGLLQDILPAACCVAAAALGAAAQAALVGTQ